ncbi:MAG: Acetyltransferase family [Herbinix sp.]|jgi:RimJ/RimL family protein N-acetyltransferase|nr:Acetyltransferase family [Herbinix sp.]
MDNNITYKVYKTMYEKDDNTYAKIAKLRWNTQDEKLDNTIAWMKKNHFGENLRTEWFEVVAYNNVNEIVGFSFFMENPNKTKQWYLGDLKVDENYLRKHIATNIIKLGLHTISENYGKSIYSYIEKENLASITLHKKLGFHNLERLEPFAEFIFGDDQTTYEYIFSNN